MDTIGAWQKCPLYGDIPFIENSSKNQKSSKVNKKSTICHDFPSPDFMISVYMISETDPRKKVRSNGTLSHPYFDIQPTTKL